MLYSNSRTLYSIVEKVPIIRQCPVSKHLKTVGTPTEPDFCGQIPPRPHPQLVRTNKYNWPKTQENTMYIIYSNIFACRVIPNPSQKYYKRKTLVNTHVGRGQT